MMKMNLVELIARFSDEEKARKYIESVRWPEGPQCPRCANEQTTAIATRNQYACSKCQHRFSVTSGTIFHDSHLPLSKWLIAVYLMLESKKGISANQLKRTLGVSYKTAWYLCHRIRAAMRGAYPFPLKGIVEVDETYVGGKWRGRKHSGGSGKLVVAGAVQRDGKIILKLVGGRDRDSLHEFVREHVSEDADELHTDAWQHYKGALPSVTHKTVIHKEMYVAPDGAHTNSIESVWSLFKRSIVGTYHKLSEKHLQAYLEELEWRFNNRDNPWLFRDTVQRLLSSNNIEYRVLTA